MQSQDQCGGSRVARVATIPTPEGGDELPPSGRVQLAPCFYPGGLDAVVREMITG